MTVYADNSSSIGNTPLVRLSRVAPAGSKVFAKIEGRNPAYSVKCRLGAALVWDAEKRGVLKPGVEIIEPTSGNTGIALAFVGAARGYKVTLVMPETMSLERRKVLKAFGATLVLTEGAKGMERAVAKATEIRDSNPERSFLPSSSRTQRIRPSTRGPLGQRSGRTRQARSTCWSQELVRAARSPAFRASSRTPSARNSSVLRSSPPRVR